MKRTLVFISALLLAGTALAAAPKYVCWDGSVAKNPRHCPPYKLPLVCPDGSIVGAASECPPIKICMDGTLGYSCPPPPPIDDPAVATQ